MNRYKQNIQHKTLILQSALSSINRCFTKPYSLWLQTDLASIEKNLTFALELNELLTAREGHKKGKEYE